MKRFLTLIFVLAVIAGSWFIYSSQQGEVEPERPEGIKTAPVTQGAIDATISATGNLEAERVEQITFSAGGEVAQVFVQEGDRVIAGQQVVLLDTRDLVLSLKQAQAALAVSEASLARARKGPSEDEIAAAEAALTAARANLDDLLEGPSQEDRYLAKLQVDQAKNSLYGAQGSRDALCGNPFADGGSKVSAEAQVLNAEIGVKIAEFNLARLYDPPKASVVASARSQITQAESNLSRLLAMPTAEDIAIAESQVVQARVGVEMAQSHLDDASLTVPFSGTLVSWNLHPGDTLAPGAPVGTLVDLSRFHITVSIDETEIGRIAPGQTVSITFDAFPDDPVEGIVGKIDLVGQQAQGIVTYGVRIDLSQTALPLKPPMTAAIDITVERKTDVLLVPNRALRRDKEGKYVEVLRDNVPTRVYVTTGLSNDDYTEIISGLEEGEEVIVGKPRENILEGTGPFGGG